MKLLFILFSVGSFLLHHGASFADPVEVSVVEGDSVTLNNCVKKNQDTLRWYYDNIRIAQINRDLRKTCTDVQCNERFRDRLKLDHQTGSLTIMNTTNTDAGVYKLTISSSINGKIFSVSVHAERDGVQRKSVKEGESVTLHPGVIKNTNDVMWHNNEILIAENTGDQSKIYTDVQCTERFRDRLKLDHQTGSLIIINTRITDSGEYKLMINSSSSSGSSSRRRRSSSSSSSIEIFAVTVTELRSQKSEADPGSGLPGSGLPGSGLSSGAVVGIAVAVLLVFVAAAVTGVGVIFSRYRSSSNDMIFKAVMEEEQPGASEESPINKIESDGGHMT